MDRESESPLIGGMGLSGHGITAFARAHAREEGEEGLGRCETRICSSKRAASRSACKLPSLTLYSCSVPLYERAKPTVAAAPDASRARD